jgi:hypothetical protein
MVMNRMATSHTGVRLSEINVRHLPYLLEFCRVRGENMDLPAYCAMTDNVLQVFSNEALFRPLFEFFKASRVSQDQWRLNPLINRIEPVRSLVEEETVVDLLFESRQTKVKMTPVGCQVTIVVTLCTGTKKVTIHTWTTLVNCTKDRFVEYFQGMRFCKFVGMLVPVQTPSAVFELPKSFGASTKMTTPTCCVCDETCMTKPMCCLSLQSNNLCVECYLKLDKCPFCRATATFTWKA